MYQTYSWKGKLSSREKGQKVILHIETWSWRQNTALQKCLPWPLGDIPWPSGLCRMWWRSQTSGQGGHPGPNLITRVLRNREICLPGVRKMQKQEEREMRSSRHSNCCCCWEREVPGPRAGTAARPHRQGDGHFSSTVTGTDSHQPSTRTCKRIRPQGRQERTLKMKARTISNDCTFKWIKRSY